MIQHFQFQSLYKHEQLPGWNISFYFNKEKMEGIYHPDGRIEWQQRYTFDEGVEEKIKGRIHELMLYHVYDNR
ncbi:DUF5342 family protein [Bacillus sp. Gen3]|uniref:DUF5342 family protein n=1 Tax=Heyndrickxia oleronia TaxID=38875 RepID=UPI0015D325E2|nr:DUF5342 family protein [Bacillus sp. Gen3]